MKTHAGLPEQQIEVSKLNEQISARDFLWWLFLSLSFGTFAAVVKGSFNDSIIPRIIGAWLAGLCISLAFVLPTLTERLTGKRWQELQTWVRLGIIIVCYPALLIGTGILIAVVLRG